MEEENVIDEIKEILGNFEKYEARYKLHNETQFIITHREIQPLLDYITNLKQNYKLIEGQNRISLLEIERLQQENEYLKLNNPEMNIEHFRIINENKRKIDNLRKQNKELQQENERLKKDYAKIVNDNCDYLKLEQENKELLKKSYADDVIITKAIGYINKNKHLSMFADCREPEEDWNYDLECNANDLLNILQNVSEVETNADENN